MQDKELKKLIEGKDFNKEEDFQAVLDGINKSENALDIKKTNSFNEKYQALEKSKNDEISTWKNKAYVYKNINNKLDDESMNDFMTLVKSRMDSDNKLKFEDAASAVSKKWSFFKPEPVAQPKVETKVEPKIEPKVEPKVEHEEVEEKQPAPINYGVRSNASASLNVDYSDNSQEAQLNRYKAFVGKK